MPRHRRRRQTEAALHLENFFARYPRFEYDTHQSASQEFRRLVNVYRWERNSRAQREAWDGFSEALGKQFASFYGTDKDDINAWQALCVALDIDPPDSIPDCIQVVKSTHVNLVDFIDTRVTGRPVTIFRTEAELREYTKRTHKIFPKDSAKESGVLKFLLREIFLTRVG